MIAIYCLIDPKTGEVRYVGQTKATLAFRLMHHISEARGSRSHSSRSLVREWILSLDDEGRVPRIELLQLVTPQIAKGFERAWIRAMHDAGYRLVNTVWKPRNERRPRSEE